MRRAFFLALAMTVSSCAAIEIRNGGTKSDFNQSGETPAPPISYTSHSILLGLYPITRAGNLAALCPDGWSSTRSYKNAWQSAVTIVTLTLYTPTTIETRCKPKSS